MAVKRAISESVMEVLRAGKITGDTFFLPPSRLDRKLYQEVNKVLVDAGGKWNKKAQGHVFPENPSEKLGLALKTGVSVNEKNLYQEFFTPNELASKVVEMASVWGKQVLEPSAGDGILAMACMAAGAQSVLCVEIQSKHCKTLKEKGFHYTINDDFLKLKPEAKFGRVVMNPPFTKKQDVKHVLHALKFLEDDGVLVSVMSGGSEPKAPKGWKFEFEDVPEGAFKSSGTGVRTRILKATRQ